jgi:hypothetical protein
LQRVGSAVSEAAPAFAAEVALATLHWICQGRGYELTSLDVQMACRLATGAGQALGQSARVHGAGSIDEFVRDAANAEWAMRWGKRHVPASFSARSNMQLPRA